MADDNKPSASKDAQVGDTLVPDAAEIMGETAAPADDASSETALLDQLEELRREYDEMRQSMLRALAETENVRRRAQRDVSDARQYAVTSFARDLLNVADNFKRAMQAAEGIDDGQIPAELKGVFEGVTMTERELASVMERHGITSIDPVGQRFDPNRHQAMFEVENPDVAHGTIVQVVQTGSMIGDRVLRPAMVGIAKGGPKASEAQKEAAADDAGESGERG
ncbi:nucleotide exchange factor GrpE [Acuticoccus mangrovi]|uniref:Protein GrpE n=1 Tax=Acuticoccus mangrovi TaxID=2796142 RepID=A0A934IHK0_9HYPH|nr:nucleotide exchange factor GrpE [Acuticoccus mangrovi]MBJ3776839.1 nucleotide exchange factor GrpE [Acuticoccus mangrovi]